MSACILHLNINKNSDIKWHKNLDKFYLRGVNAKRVDSNPE